MTDPEAFLAAHLVVERPNWSLDIEIAAEAGTVTAVIGPNGAGKSTSLQALAGLCPLDGGFAELAGRRIEEPASGTRVPPEDRGVGYVFQDYLLFPRLSARENVAFGLRARGVPRARAHQVADDWLRRVSLADVGERRPRELSGGQAQRVALARALATDPQLLLLDEPLAALDAGTRMSVRTQLRSHLDAFSGVAIVVTHDPLDALVLADRVIVVESGRVVQAGTPADIARHPRTRYVAQLIGLNLLRGVAHGATVELDGSGNGEWATTDDQHGEVFVAVRPSAIGVYGERPHGSPRNTWAARVTGLEQQGHVVRMAASGPPDVVVDVTAEAIAELRLGLGSPVWLSVKATDLAVYPV
jgi:molybdate transport system ATP-binding protein